MFHSNDLCSLSLHIASLSEQLKSNIKWGCIVSNVTQNYQCMHLYFFINPYLLVLFMTNQVLTPHQKNRKFLTTSSKVEETILLIVVFRRQLRSNYHTDCQIGKLWLIWLLQIFIQYM